MTVGKRLLPFPLVILIFYCLILLILILLLQNFPRFMAPILFAGVTAYIFNPLVNWVEKKTRWNRTLLTSILILLLVSAFVLMIVFIIPYLIEQSQRAAHRLPSLMDQIELKLHKFDYFLQNSFPDFTNKINLAQEMERTIQKFTAGISKRLLDLFSGLYDLVLSLIFMILLPLFSFYLIRDSGKIRENLLSLVPPQYREQVIAKGQELNRALGRFIRGQVIVVFILIVLYTTGLSLLSVPFALVIGIFAGIGDIIPYFGTIIGLIASLVFTLVEFQSLEKIILVILLFAVVKGSENWYFYPKIVGREIGLHLLWVLVSLIFFGQFFGFWGLVVAIPAATLFRVFFGDLMKYYRKSAFYQGNAPPE